MSTVKLQPRLGRTPICGLAKNGEKIHFSIKLTRIYSQSWWWRWEAMLNVKFISYKTMRAWDNRRCGCGNCMCIVHIQVPCSSLAVACGRCFDVGSSRIVCEMISTKFRMASACMCNFGLRSIFQARDTWMQYLCNITYSMHSWIMVRGARWQGKNEFMLRMIKSSIHIQCRPVCVHF